MAKKKKTEEVFGEFGDYAIEAFINGEWVLKREATSSKTAKLYAELEEEPGIRVRIVRRGDTEHR